MCLPEDDKKSEGTASTTASLTVVPDAVNAHNRTLWRKEQPKEFSWSKDPEPHVLRRGQILAKHPEIKNLYVTDSFYSPLFCVITCIVQLAMAVMVSRLDLSWWVIIPLAWAISGTMNHSLVLAMHELSHDLWFPKFRIGGENGSALVNAVVGSKGYTFNPNPWFAFLINCPTCAASASTFKRYHLEHHSFQGSDKWDADIPTRIEGKLFSSTIGKLIFVSLQVLFYAFRPIMTKPKPISLMEIMNWVVVGTFDFLVVILLGPKAFGYLFAGSILGLGLHPMAGHFIAEHFEFIQGVETYSYYGPLNSLTYNVGYHNEHHDAPKVCGRLLPLIREICRTGGVPKRKDRKTLSWGQTIKNLFFLGIEDWEIVNKDSSKASPEFYEDLPHYDSWSAVLTGFIFGRPMNCFCRVKRSP